MSTLSFVNILVFFTAAGGIWMCGSRLTAYADEISDRYKIGKAFMGFVFLAMATELPEVVTTLTATIGGNASLALNNMFGGVALQTAILVFADIAARGAPLTFYPRKPMPMLSASALVFLLAVLLGVVILGDWAVWGHVGAGSILLAVIYGLIIYRLRLEDRHDAPWMPVTVPEDVDQDNSTWVSSFPQIDNKGLSARFLAMSIAILGLGLILVSTGEQIAVDTGLGNSFVGATLLAGSTSLPELSTTIAAVRIKSYTMAISNIFGSNLIMLALIFPADVAYRPAPILSATDTTAKFAIVSGIIVTVIYLHGLIARGRREVLGMGVDSAAVAVVYGASLVVFYGLS